MATGATISQLGDARAGKLADNLTGNGHFGPTDALKNGTHETHGYAAWSARVTECESDRVRETLKHSNTLVLSYSITLHSPRTRFTSARISSITE